MKKRPDSARQGPSPDALAAQTAVCHCPPIQPPSAWIERWIESAVRRMRNAPNVGKTATVAWRALDWGCGAGRHAQLAASHGFAVWALDQDLHALATHGEPGAAGAVTGLEADLESGADPVLQDLVMRARGGLRFDLIIVANYLFRPRLALLMSLLAPGGLLIYETFALGNAQFGRPARAEFLLQPHELLDRARGAGLIVLGFEQGVQMHPKPAAVQRLAAQAPGNSGAGAIEASQGIGWQID